MAWHRSGAIPLFEILVERITDPYMHRETSMRLKYLHSKLGNSHENTAQHIWTLLLTVLPWPLVTLLLNLNALCNDGPAQLWSHETRPHLNQCLDLIFSKWMTSLPLLPVGRLSNATGPTSGNAACAHAWWCYSSSWSAWESFSPSSSHVSRHYLFQWNILTHWSLWDLNDI